MVRCARELNAAAVLAIDRGRSSTMKRKVLVYKIQIEIDPATINVGAMLAALEPGRVEE